MPKIKVKMGRYILIESVKDYEDACWDRATLLHVLPTKVRHV